jgi:sulfonate transport system substrate-binding protein
LSRRFPTRRRLRLATAAALLAAIAAAVGLASTSASGAAKVTIVVGVPRNFGYLSTLWARNVQPPGVNVEYKYFPVFTDMLTALNAGQIDLTEIGDVGAAQSYVNGGGKVQAIAVTQPNSLNCGLLVPKTSTITSFAQLKGQKIIFLRSTNSYIGFLHQLQASGLQESDFDIVELSGPPANEAFANGQVAGYYTIDPNMADIVDQTGAHEIASCKSIGVQNVYPYVATTSAIQTKSKALGEVVQALADNFAWIKAHRQQQAQLLSKKLGFSQASILTTYKRGSQALQLVSPAWLATEQKVFDQLITAKIVPSPVKSSQVFLTQFNNDIKPRAGAANAAW